MKEIITTQDWENEVKLSNRSQEIDTVNEAKLVREIVHELKDTMRKKGLKHLTAPAIGYNRRIFCIDFEDCEIKTYVNPVIMQCSGIQLTTEECSSIPGKKFVRPRNNDINIMFQNPMGKYMKQQLVGLAAIVAQHECDHLDGVLLSDVGLEVDDEYENASDEEKMEIMNMYLDSLDLKMKDLDTEIDADEDLKELKSGIEYLTAVAEGKVEVERD